MTIPKPIPAPIRNFLGMRRRVLDREPLRFSGRESTISHSGSSWLLMVMAFCSVKDSGLAKDFVEEVACSFSFYIGGRRVEVNGEALNRQTNAENASEIEIWR